MFGTLTDPLGNTILRYSAVLQKLATVGDPSVVEQLQKDVANANNGCKRHGVLEDPIIFVVKEPPRIVLACPDCSGSKIKALWESQAVTEES